jgi:transcriptional regulator with XRE-family HTH domain
MTTEIGGLGVSTRRFRDNVKMLKALRGISDQELADAGGYSSRQQLNGRLSGRTTPDLDDVDRIAAALHVSPEAMMFDRIGLLQWCEMHPDFKAKPIKKQARSRKVSS